MSRQDPQTNLRMPRELKNSVIESAKNNRWSINTWINVAIEEKLARDQKNEAA